MIVDALDGQYWITTDVGVLTEEGLSADEEKADSAVARPAQSGKPIIARDEGEDRQGRGVRLTPGFDVVHVQTINEDDDERVDLQTDYWEDGEPDFSSQLVGWAHIATCEFAVSRAAWVSTTEGQVIEQVTPGAGHFGLLLMARHAPEWLKDPEGPREQHRLNCWPIRMGREARREG